MHNGNYKIKSTDNFLDHCHIICGAFDLLQVGYLMETAHDISNSLRNSCFKVYHFEQIPQNLMVLMTNRDLLHTQEASMPNCISFCKAVLRPLFIMSALVFLGLESIIFFFCHLKFWHFVVVVRKYFVYLIPNKIIKRKAGSHCQY